MSSAPLTLLFGAIGPVQIVIVLVVILLLFGNKLPTMARSLGSSFTEFKKGVKGITDESSDPNARLEDKEDAASKESAKEEKRA